MRDTQEERETIITYNQGPDEAHIFTCDPVLMRHLESKGVRPERIETAGGRISAKEYRVPKRWVKVNPPRQVTESQREAARQISLRRQKVM